MLQQPVSIITELEEAVRSGSSARRVSTQRQVTDLFLYDGERLSEDQIKVFDDVPCHLVILIPCKSAGLGCTAVESILRLRPIKHPTDEATLKLASKDYTKLSVETAERTVRFWHFATKSRS